jgi:ribosome-binding factor A
MSIRTERVAAVVQRDLGRIMQKEYQPSGSFITVTQVEMTPDLMMAKIFISIYAPGKDEEAIYRRLKDKKADIRQKMASKMRHQLRRIPELDFNKDESAEYAEKMDRLFEQIHDEQSDSSGEEQQ